MAKPSRSKKPINGSKSNQQSDPIASVVAADFGTPQPQQPPAAQAGPIKLLTRQDVADALSVCTETVKRWQRQGQLKATILSHNIVRYHPDEYNRFVKERNQANTPETAIAS